MIDKTEIDKMTLREVMEFSRKIPIRDGGLEILIEKIVSAIEELQNNET